MKKILSFALCLILMFSFMSCKKKEPEVPEDNRSYEERMEDFIRDYGISNGLQSFLNEYYGSRVKNIDMYQTRYNIGTIKYDYENEIWTVYGTYTVYEKNLYEEVGDVEDRGKFEMKFDSTGFYIPYSGKRKW